MGEYALYRGSQIKIGTCEDMYYLRADQARHVTPQRGNVKPASAEDQKVIRFRFPWPDEDGVAPGSFDDYARGVRVTCEIPADVEQQAYRGGLLVAICRCGGCGALFRLPTLKDAEPLLVGLRAEADERERRNESGKWWHTVADRVAAGYNGTPEDAALRKAEP